MVDQLHFGSRIGADSSLAERPDRKTDRTRLTVLTRARCVCDTDDMADSESPADISTSRRTKAARFCVIAFGLLLVTSLAVSSLSAISIEPGMSMTFAGAMVACGFAELIDQNQRTLVAALRFGGMATMLLGFLLQLL